MRTAYLILAHHQPSHLKRLVAALSCNSSAFFIHLDEKADASQFAELSSRQVQFTPKRIAVFWGDFSQVEAILVLIQTAMSHPSTFERFVLLSGVDYPLRSAVEIQDFFAEHANREFINLVPMPCDFAGKPITRLSDFKLRPASTNPVRKLQEALLRLRVLPRVRNFSRYLGDLKPYGGSTWWALSRGACSCILTFVERHPRVVHFFKNTHCPDEMIFQTILGNSEFRSKIDRNLTYADWSAGGSRPTNLSGAHLPLLLSRRRFPAADAYGEGEMLFARKFSGASEDLLKALDAKAHTTHE